MFKITEVQVPYGARRLKLQGRLLGPWIDALRVTCDGRSSTTERLELDLAELSFVDSSCAIVLRDLICRGAVVTRSSPFIRALLNEERTL
jgi:ABC-type transporter Mla MlaB component